MDVLPICVNGYDTFYAKLEDTRGKFLLVAVPKSAEAAKDIADGICGNFLEGHLIEEIKFFKKDDKWFFKAYF